jgi:hypothetical protein
MPTISRATAPQQITSVVGFSVIAVTAIFQ